MQISVFGLGYVGAVAAGCLASQGHEVIAVDSNAAKVGMLRRGLAPVNELGLGELVKEAAASGKLTATTNIAEAVAGSALSSICAPTPAIANGGRDLAEIMSFCEQIGTALRDKPKFHSLVLRSSLPAGATRGLLIPLLERASGKRAGVDFGVAVYPAFLRKTTAIEDYVNPPAIILGVTDDETLARLREMDIALQAPEMVVDLAEAEAMAHAGGRWSTAHASSVNRSTVLSSVPIAAGGLGGE